MEEVGAVRFICFAPCLCGGREPTRDAFFRKFGSTKKSSKIPMSAQAKVEKHLVMLHMPMARFRTRATTKTIRPARIASDRRARASSESGASPISRQIGVFQPFERPVVHAGKNFNRHVYVPRAAFAIHAVFSLRREVLPHFTPHKFHRRIPESNPIPVFLASVRPMRIASLKAVEPQEGGGCFASARPRGLHPAGSGNGSADFNFASTRPTQNAS